jgi:hypothetical protein
MRTLLSIEHYPTTMYGNTSSLQRRNGVGLLSSFAASAPLACLALVQRVDSEVLWRGG